MIEANILEDITNDFIHDYHAQYVFENNEPMDSDYIEDLCEYIKLKLNLLNGNI